MVSIYRGFGRGTLLIKSFKVGLDQFEQPPEKTQFFRFVGGKLKYRRLEAGVISQIRRSRAAMLDLKESEEFASATVDQKLFLMAQAYSSSENAN